MGKHCKPPYPGKCCDKILHTVLKIRKILSSSSCASTFEKLKKIDLHTLQWDSSKGNGSCIRCYCFRNHASGNVAVNAVEMYFHWLLAMEKQSKLNTFPSFRDYVSFMFPSNTHTHTTLCANDPAAQNFERCWCHRVIFHLEQDWDAVREIALVEGLKITYGNYIHSIINT